MILLNTHLTSLTAGYDLIRDAHLRLKDKWRHPLLEAYARRQQAYRLELADFHQRRQRYQVVSLGGVVLATLVVILGLAACPLQIRFQEGFNFSVLCSSPLALLAGGAGIIILLTRRRKYSLANPAPPPPEHPLRGSLIAPLLPEWQGELKGYLPADPPDEGAPGEFAMVHRLEQVHSHSYILYRAQQRPGEDVDIIAAGPRGVWVFEVKYWAGQVIYQDGVWKHLKTWYEPGSGQVTREKPFSQPPDAQWRRARDDVAETLRRRLPELLQRIPQLETVQGGLAFTHEDGEHLIEPGTVTWGNIAFWDKHLRQAPLIPGLGEREVMQILDALLRRHHQVSQASGSKPALRSMEACAQRLISQCETAIQEYLIINPPS
ncbi:MAG: NERD domain-containing protein [Anaerolineales bacterium]|nr:NERD domain-containing protein [Anaerolineales bacterium]